jgi:predicted nucleic acid-binding protein
MSAADTFFDTNVLVYLLSEDAAKADRAEALIASGGVVSVQVLNEFASIASRKLAMQIAEIQEVLSTIRTVCTVVPLDVETHDLGLEVAERQRLSIYDAMIVAAAQRAGCRILYTEDLNPGQKIDRLTIRNPFVASGRRP